ncbi:MAG TPA: flippase-like domain-containing protein [Candidatus Hydrogenedentes bacterium]|nr:flippase-like domain-containing protein [Candidatus Hydrogenedentota bacterium]
MSHTLWWKNPWLAWTVKLLIGVILIALLFTTVDLRSVFRTFASSSVPLCIAAYLGMLLITTLNALQLRWCMANQDIALPLARGIEIQLVAMLYGLVTPSAIGAGAVKWYKLSDSGRYRAQAAAVLVYLRAANTVILLSLACVALLWERRIDSGYIRALTAVLLAASFLLFLTLCSNRFATTVGLGIHGKASRRLPQALTSAIGRLWTAFEALSRLPKSRLAAILSLSLLIEASGIAVFLLLARAVGLDIPLLALAWLRLIIIVVQLPPVSIAGLGMREGALVLLLPELYGAASEQALALSFLLLGRRIFLGLLGGLCEIMRAFHRPSERLSS